MMMIKKFVLRLKKFPQQTLTMILVEGLLVLAGEHEVGVQLLVLLKVPLHGRRELGVKHFQTTVFRN
jgi:hypothetical protein